MPSGSLRGLQIGTSYHQRLNPGSPLTVGGEVWFIKPIWDIVKRAPDAPPSLKPVEWTFGGAYDTKASKTGVHLTWNGAASGALLHLHHLYRLNDRCVLVAKNITNTKDYNSMSAVGYKLSFRNSGASIAGMADTYGGVRVTTEHEILEGVKVTSFLHYAPGQRAPPRGAGADDTANTLGFKVSVGKLEAIPAPMSPCTLNRTQFRVQ